MSERKITEHVELDSEREWEYLSRFYDVASRFYGVNDRPVSDAEAEARIRAFKMKPAPRVRRELELDRWRFTLDETDEGLRAEYFAFGFREESWNEVNLPHSVNHVPSIPVRFGSTRHAGLVSGPDLRWDIWKADYSTWYRTRVPVGKPGPGQVAYLSFDSVNLTADVWVNEMPVMIDHLGLFPFRMDVTDEMGWGEGKETVITLRVRGRANNTPFLFGDGLQMAYGRAPYVGRGVQDTDWRDESWTGIAGHARLSILDRVHIEDAFFVTRELGEGRAGMTCRVELRNESRERFAGSLRLEVSLWHPGEGPVSTACTAKAAVPPLGDAATELAFDIEAPRAWSPESPNLYLARVILSDAGGRDLDDVCETFGVRTIRMEGAGLYLNGRRIVPRGTHDLANFTRPDGTGDSLICPSDRSIVMDILLSKGMGATCSRLPSDARMHYPRIAEYADQLGFMLSWTGYFEMWTVHPEMEMFARRDVRAMVRSLRNRPSVIIWEMGDEPLVLVHDHRRLAWYELVHGLVAEQDGSRPIIPAGSWSNELVDMMADQVTRGMPMEEARVHVLADYPALSLANAPWDFHHCPYFAPPGKRPTPVHEVIRGVREALRGERATIFTEFGLDGMPRPGNVDVIYGGFRWTAPAIMPSDRGRKDINYYGRPLGPSDWKQSQAAQAVALASIIDQLREAPESFAGYYFPTLVDAWTFYWGVVDAAFNVKLAWFVIASSYAEVYATALHGSVAHARAEPLEITVGSHGDPLDGLSLGVVVRDAGDAVAYETTLGGIHVPGGAGVGVAARLPLVELQPGLYSIELTMTGDRGAVVARRVELFYLV